MKIKSSFLVVLKAALLIICAILAGGVILTLAYCIPVNQKLQQESYDAIKKEGWYPAIPYVEDSLAVHFHSFLPGVLDGSTDSIMLSTAGHIIEGSPIEAAMRSYNDVFQYDYPRYWHGYVTILRPLMQFLDYADIRFINMLGQLSIIIAMAIHLYQKKGKAYVVMLLSSYALLMPMAMSFSLQFSWVFYIAGFAGLFVMKKQKILEKRSGYVYFFVIVGALTSYMDLLTYPLITWGIPMIWWIVLSDREETGLTYIKRVVISGISWICGYGGMWCGKWILGSLVLGENVIQNAVENIFFRVGNSEESMFSFVDRLNAVYTNWKHYSYRMYFLILALWLVWIAARSVFHGVKTTKKCPALLLVGCSGVVWYLVMSNHTAGHHFFTYRIYNVSILAFMAYALECLLSDKMLDSQEKNLQKKNLHMFPEKINWRRILFTGLVWSMILFASRGLMQLARETFFVMNGEQPVDIIEVEEGQYVECTFIPSFSEIESFGFGMSTEKQEGSYRITILDNGVPLYQEQLSVDSADDTLYKTIPVCWELSAGKAYTMRWELSDHKGTYSVAITKPDCATLSEYRNLVIDGKEYGGQVLSGITYWAIPRERDVRIFVWLTWMGILAAVAVWIEPSIEAIRKNNQNLQKSR